MAPKDGIAKERSKRHGIATKKGIRRAKKIKRSKLKASSRAKGKSKKEVVEEIFGPAAAPLSEEQRSRVQSREGARSSKRKAWEYAHLEEPRMAQGREDNDVVVELRYNTRVGKRQSTRGITTTFNVRFEDGQDATNFRYELDRRIKYLKRRARSIMSLRAHQRGQRNLVSQAAVV